VRVLVITGEGNKFFCTGGDLSELVQGLADIGLHIRKWHDLVDMIEAAEKPVIAAMNGHAVGGGLELALACHQRIASARGRFGVPELNAGLFPSAGGVRRLTRLLGASTRDFGAVEIHEMSNEDGMMGMRPLIYGLKVEAGETLDLNPMTSHIMLIGPRRTFKAGQKVSVTLHFLNAGTIQLKATVQPYRPGANTDHTGHQGH
jgi:copper(I)-binding protein